MFKVIGLKAFFYWVLFLTVFQAQASIGSVNFTIDKTSIYRGNTVTLSWNTPQNATYYDLNVLKPGASHWLTFRRGYTSNSFNRFINKNGVHSFYISACNPTIGFNSLGMFLSL
ncbi:hypothetical protein OM33_20510 [Pseudoalteromonas piratica]|uniref:Uncharacterized protein n=1 Tax=Pseudoalteromonas piratica TaxID=1348114 RepID=A0A0A7EMW5_9GAMM|nr:hypothetical protein OM33_20510 [Pseudoalteromonas piratica]